ncbi:hypothetical protein AB0E75_00890 [Streptomyces griseoviridis]|uniref:DUF1648 domain-containing protein n=3 Tax=Streptomyces TaxID=1883 RepID=A0A918G5U6_STRGD|nr:MULTISPECIES: hypothetical protein [Streptomyces]MDP9681587.1 putative membrane protein [Streptomyces griseoviridis]GGS19902.1 hypothetical protein GCM10010238_05120 [Streptomyces niveoruber]GGS73486.1 hypothetical protein GCM10010240_03050 [Streptomyces griseoviridis]GGU43766.1 hypothetical protein GCM10010259_38250 [Streptomyces daghestanicus]GHI34416.1 hypothetical protein Sdagh_61460 [Streptomyces daghestanicus]
MTSPLVFSSPSRAWPLPGAVPTVALTVWGVLRYPRLPERLPRHIGAEGVDAWTASRSAAPSSSSSRTRG